MALRFKILILLLGIGISFVVAGAYLKSRHDASELMFHCMGVNNKDIIPYPGGCLTPIDLKDGVLTFINVSGMKERYVVIRLRDGTFKYAKVGNV